MYLVSICATLKNVGSHDTPLVVRIRFLFHHLGRVGQSGVSADSHSLLIQDELKCWISYCNRKAPAASRIYLFQNKTPPSLHCPR